MTLVTLSASYGAGGSEVGPALARRLGAPFVDRVIPTDVAARLAVGVEAWHAGDDVTSSRLLSRLLMSLAPIGDAYGGGPIAESVDPSRIGDATEQVIFERADSGCGVILGHGAAVVLRDDSRAFHARLDGPREGRLRQAMRIQGIERDEAERRMKYTDRARYAYVRRFRHADALDPSLYHLIVDSTVVALDDCVELIAMAAERHTLSAAATAPAGSP